MHSWIEAVGPEDEASTWGKDVQLYFDLHDLFRQIADDKALDKIKIGALPNAEKPTTIEWLMSVLQFAIEQDETELLSEHAVVPNHIAGLFKLSELYEEDATMPIPDAVLDVLGKLGVDWRAELIHRAIRLEGIQHQRRGLRDASEKVAEQLISKKQIGQGGSGSPFLQREDALDILFEILSMVPPAARDSFQSKLFKSAAFLFGHEGGLRKVEGVAEFNFAPALRLMIEAIHAEISRHGTIAAMAEALEVEEERVVNWLDDHLRLVANNSEYEHYLKVGDIVPSRKGAFMAFEDVYAYGTEETPLDPTLIDVLHQLDAEQDWDEVLVADGIGIRLPNKRTMEELGSAIQKAVAAIKLEPTSVQEHRESLLQLIEWCEHNEVEAKRHLAGFLQYKNAMFFELVAKGNIGSSVIRMLGSEAGVNILKRIAESGMDADEVDKLLDLGQELGSLSELIERAEELVEERRDFEFKKKLGESIEVVFMEALKRAGVDADIIYQGGGSHDVEIKSRSNGRSYYIEIKSISAANSEPLKLAVSQARAFVKQPEGRALCVLERGVRANAVTADYIRSQLKYRKGIGKLLQKGLEHHEQLEQIIMMDEVDVSLLGAVRIKLKRNLFMKDAEGFDELIEDIRSTLAQ